MLVDAENAEELMGLVNKNEEANVRIESMPPVPRWVSVFWGYKMARRHGCISDRAVKPTGANSSKDMQRGLLQCSTVYKNTERQTCCYSGHFLSCSGLCYLCLGYFLPKFQDTLCFEIESVITLMDFGLASHSQPLIQT